MAHRRLTILGPWLLLLACGPSADAGEDGDGMTSAAATGEATTTGSATGEATTTSSATGEATTTSSATGEAGETSNTDDTDGSEPSGSLGMGHGVVLVELLRAPEAVDDPFVGTARVEVDMLYRQCLIDFYEAEPSWRQDGPDGSAVFDAALDAGLCDPSNPELVECTIVEIVQQLDVTKAIGVTYEVTGPLEGRRLRFGPLPSQELAACPDGGLPVVRLGSNGAVRGFDAMGTQIWQTQSFSPSEAATDQGAPISIRATPS